MSGTARATPWRLEWRLFHGDRTVRVLALAFTALLGVAAATGRGWVAFQRETIQRVTEAERARYDSMAATAARYAAGDTAGRTPWTDPRMPNIVAGPRGGRYVALPPTPLAPLAVGQSDVLPYYTRVTNGAKLGFAGSDEIENPLNLLTGRFDLAFALIIVFPLLILVLTFNVTAGEREGGTLGLLLALPEAPGRLLGRKLLLRGGAAIGVALLGTSVVALATGGAAAPGRLALVLALVVAYGLFWLGVGAAINAMGRGSGTSAVMALAAWLVVVVLAPTLFGAAVSVALPPPSRVALMTELRETSDAVNARGEALLQKYYLDHPEMMGGGGGNMKNFALRAAVVAEELDQAMAPAMTAFDAAVRAQLALADRWRYASPALVAHGALLDLAGTSSARYRAFDTQVDAFHRAWRQYFTPGLVSGAMLTPTDLGALPQFTFVEEPLGTVAARVLPGLALLVLLGTGLLLFSVRRLGATGVVAGR